MIPPIVLTAKITMVTDLLIWQIRVAEVLLPLRATTIKFVKVMKITRRAQEIVVARLPIHVLRHLPHAPLNPHARALRISGAMEHAMGRKLRVLQVPLTVILIMFAILENRRVRAPLIAGELRPPLHARRGITGIRQRACASPQAALFVPLANIGIPRPVPAKQLPPLIVPPASIGTLLPALARPLQPARVCLRHS